MGTENSSIETRARAKALARYIGRYVCYKLVHSCRLNRQRSDHTDLDMTTVVNAVRDLFVLVTNARPRFRIHGGTNAENLALQNIQARFQRSELKSMY
jgi:NAD+ synthase (glutamine-hydrolysing)